MKTKMEQQAVIDKARKAFEQGDKVIKEANDLLKRQEKTQKIILILWILICWVGGFILTWFYPSTSLIEGFNDTFLFWMTACVFRPLGLMCLSIMLGACIFLISQIFDGFLNLIRKIWKFK